MKIYEGVINGSRYKIGIVLSKSNKDIVEKLFKNTVEELYKSGIEETDITVYKVPGCLEIPRIAKKIVAKKDFDVIICLGVIIKFGSPIFEFMGNSLMTELLRISSEKKIPLINGIIITEQVEQANKDADTYGKKVVLASLEMASLEDITRIISF